METLDEDPTYEISAVGFKSYYVVWKHLLFLLSDRVPGVFKSYYVVWKLSSAVINV